MRRLRQAQEISDAATAEPDLHEILHTLVDRLRLALHADTATILLLNDEATELEVAASHGLERELQTGLRIPIGAGFAGRVAAARRAVVAGDEEHGDEQGEPQPEEQGGEQGKLLRERLRALAGKRGRLSR